MSDQSINNDYNDLQANAWLYTPPLKYKSVKGVIYINVL